MGMFDKIDSQAEGVGLYNKGDSNLKKASSLFGAFANPQGTAQNLIYDKVVFPMWNGNQSRLDEIKKAQEEANASEWNTSKVTPQMLDSYNKWSQEYAQMKAAEKYGLSDAEKNLAINQNAQGMNFAQMNAERAGGNAGAYINSVLNAGNNEFGLKLASADAELQRQKRMQTLSALEGLNRNASVFQDVNSLNFQKQTMAEQALGQAESDWYANKAADRRALLSTGASLIGAAAKGAAGSA